MSIYFDWWNGGVIPQHGPQVSIVTNKDLH